MERLGICVSKKAIRQLMKEMCLTVKQPRLSLPLAGMDTENAGCRAQAFYVKERMFPG